MCDTLNDMVPGKDAWTRGPTGGTCGGLQCISQGLFQGVRAKLGCFEKAGSMSTTLVTRYPFVPAVTKPPRLLISYSCEPNPFVNEFTAL